MREFVDAYVMCVCSYERVTVFVGESERERPGKSVCVREREREKPGERPGESV